MERGQKDHEDGILIQELLKSQWWEFWSTSTVMERLGKCKPAAIAMRSQTGKTEQQ